MLKAIKKPRTFSGGASVDVDAAENFKRARLPKPAEAFWFSSWFSSWFSRSSAWRGTIGAERAPVNGLAPAVAARGPASGAGSPARRRQGYRPDFPFFDTTALHVDKAVELALFDRDRK